MSEKYSLLRVIPLFASVMYRSFIMFIRIIGEIWLFSTFLLLFFLRAIGRLVLFWPFILIAYFILLAFYLGYGLKRTAFLLGRLFLAIGNGTIKLISLPVLIGRFILLLPRKKKEDFKVPINKLQDAIKKKYLAVKEFLNRPIKIPWQIFTYPFLSFFRRYRIAASKYRWQLVGASASFCLLIAASGFIYLEIIADMPSPFKLKEIQIPASTRILDRYGRLLFNIYRSENRTLVKLSELPPYVIWATIAIEDADFYHHNGISLRGIVRAAKANYFDGQSQFIQGGSTITQQLVKNLLLTPEKTIKRKIKEMILALFMETFYTKDEILQMYLNEVAYGGPQYGIEEAANYYFGKSAKYLTLGEAALLAGLPTQPSKNSPFINPEAAIARQHLVLDRMVKNGYITEAEAAKAKRERLVFVPNRISIKAPHFVMMVRQALIEHFGRELVEEGGLQVYTTLDLETQAMVERAVRENIARIGKAYRVGNGAALVTKPQTGEVIALVGSVDYFNTEIKGNVNIVTSRRQPGSSIKPVNYAYAFEHGWHPGSVIDDSPVVYRIPGSKPYAPVNYDNQFKGRMTLRAALAQSRNIPAVKLLDSYGEDAVLKMVAQGRKMGITTWDTPQRYGLALTLGAAEVTMLDMATVYGTIADMGVRRDPILITKVLKPNGEILVDNTRNKNFFSGLIRPAYAKDEMGQVWQQGKRVLSKIAAYWLIDILSDNKARMPAFGPYSKLEIPGRQVAVKTGTTNDFRDNWTIGFTPDYLVATWVGNTDNTPMNSRLVSGITGAAPMWNQIMTNLVANLPKRVWAPPEEMIPVKICAVNGLLTCQNCPLTVTEYFKPGTEPTKACNFEAPEVCAAKKAQAEAEGKSPEEMKAILANCILPPATLTPSP